PSLYSLNMQPLDDIFQKIENDFYSSVRSCVSNISYECLVNDDFIEVKFDVPGIEKEDIKLQVENNLKYINIDIKTLRNNTNNEKDRKDYYSEIMYGERSQILSIQKSNDVDV